MPNKPVSVKPTRSIARAYGYSLAITAGSFLAAFFLAGYVYPLSPGLWQTIANALPPIGLQVSPFTAAYFFTAGLVWFVVNGAAFVTRQRSL